MNCISGAAFGRMIGEAMALLFPYGVRTDGQITKIVPGAYAIVGTASCCIWNLKVTRNVSVSGATAFSGAVTHALSTSVVVVEITGQILYILPTIVSLKSFTFV